MEGRILFCCCDRLFLLKAAELCNIAAACELEVAQPSINLQLDN